MCQRCLRLQREVVSKRVLRGQRRLHAGQPLYVRRCWGNVRRLRSVACRRMFGDWKMPMRNVRRLRQAKAVHRGRLRVRDGMYGCRRSHVSAGHDKDVLRDWRRDDLSDVREQVHQRRLPVIASNHC